MSSLSFFASSILSPPHSLRYEYAIAPDNPFGIEGHLAVVHLTPADGGGTALHYHQFLNHPNLEAVLPVVAGGTDEIVGNILAEFGGHGCRSSIQMAYRESVTKTTQHS